MNWQLIWQVVFVALLAGFGVMSVLVIINGARDIRRLIAYLEQSRGEDEHAEPDQSPPS